uniref:Uncharacterized protein n=1 Tax=Oryza punctata TaxID=4537 RepID=A0A0E0L777_ORYPU
MADVLLGSERRVLISASALPPPESLLGRLDQLDLRLRQLEEQRRAKADDDDGGGGGGDRGPAAHHQHTKSMPSALQHVQVKGSLMDRLNLLESRIRQLSCELDVAAAGGSNAPAAARPAEDRAWSEQPLPEPCKDQAPVCAADAGGGGAHFLYKGARQLHRTKPNTSTKQNLKEAKCACEKEKRKAEERWKPARRRWFNVGC